MITSLIIILSVIVKVIFATLAERKVKGSMQRRIGPNTVGYKGLLQPLTDGLKLIIKEGIIPNHANKILFILSPFFFFAISLLNWFIIPLDFGLSIGEIKGGGLLYTIALSEISILGILYAGYSSNSKYSLLGSLRAVAQMISYSIAKSLAIIIIVLTVGDIEFLNILESQKRYPLIIGLFPIGLTLILSCVAEVGRPPFDLKEAESELVSGHKTEYSGVAFAFFFLAEYSMKLFKGVFITVLLFGFINPVPFIFLLYWLRASLPRIRIDHILSKGWNHLLPFLTGYILFLPGILFILDLT
jgi:NADH-ubiquinone oxidoreductase chain 1